ncbi:MAG TPA: hypothetical protein VJ874_06860, partial [Candidatus Thermoplasmatota archaeon]|nr:hypothetical protein [Candidatus Thermoplasmatota archaeon]
RSAGGETIGIDGVVVFTLLVTNRGNVPLNVTAVAEVVDAETGEVAQPGEVLLDGATRERTVAPGNNSSLTWNATGKQAGQYRLFVRVNNDTEYSKANDFRSAGEVLRSQWAETGPAINGTLGDGEWHPLSEHVREFRDPYGHPESRSAGEDEGMIDNARVRVMNNDTRLWISVSMPQNAANGGLAVLFDDGAGGLAPGHGDGLLGSATPGAAAPAIDLVFTDTDKVRTGDARLNGDRTPGPVGEGGEDLGLALADDERLSGYQALPSLVLDLDGSGRVSLGDFDATGGLLGASAVWDEAGHAYIFGGNGPSGLLDSILHFDAASNTMSTVAGAKLPTPREGTSAVWASGSAYVFGGRGPTGPLDQVVRFTPATNEVEVLGVALPEARSDTAAVWDGSSTAYILGGRGASGPEDDVYRFRPDPVAVATDGSLPSKLSSSSAVWAGGKAYVFGGDTPGPGPAGIAQSDDIYEYTPDDAATSAPDGAASSVASMETGRAGSSAAWDASAGRAYVFGGRNGTLLTPLLADVFTFTPAGNVVAGESRALPSPRHASAAVWDPAGRALLFGGGQAASYVNRVVVYPGALAAASNISQPTILPTGVFVGPADFRSGTNRGQEPVEASASAFRLFEPVLRFHDSDGDGRFTEGDTLFRQPQRLPWVSEACSGTLTLPTVPTGATLASVRFPASGVPDGMALLDSTGFSQRAVQTGGPGGAIYANDTASEADVVIGPTLTLHFTGAGTLTGGSVRFTTPTGEGEPVLLSSLPCFTRSAAGSNWTAAWRTTGPANGGIDTFELEGPLQGGPDDLHSGLGGSVRMLILRGNLRFPAAAVLDGEGIVPTDGDLEDELALWATVRLAKEGGDTSIRRTSPGFGVERVPPPLLEDTLSDCEGLAGWTQTAIHSPTGFAGQDVLRRTVDKWNCAPYGADGRLRLYEGASPDATCGDARCPQWSGVEGLAGFGFKDIWNPNDLISPAFRIGDDVATPYLTLRHQYSTSVEVDDVSRDIRLNSAGRVFVQVLEGDERTGTWGDPILVIPQGGYSTEASNPDLFNGEGNR